MSEFCGGCCSDVTIPLTETELKQLEEAGTSFEVILHAPGPDEPGWDSPEGQSTIFKQVRLAAIDGRASDRDMFLRAGITAQTMNNREGLYQMGGRCAFLGMLNECTGYEERPSICKAFRPGGENCRNILQNHDLPESVSRVTVSIKS